jgi:hypothetical protein
MVPAAGVVLVTVGMTGIKGEELDVVVVAGDSVGRGVATVAVVGAILVTVGVGGTAGGVLEVIVIVGVKVGTGV